MTKIYKSSFSILIKIFFLACISSFVFGCTKPQYIAPADEFEVSKPTYYQSVSKIESYIRTNSNPKTLSELNAEKINEQKTAIDSLTKLAGEGHIPSATLVARYRLATYDGVKSALRNNRYRAKLFPDLPNHINDKSTALSKLKDLEKTGIETLTVAARYGFSPAIAELYQRKLPIPTVDLKASKILRAELEYQNKMKEYDESSKRFAKGLVDAFAAGLNAYAAGQAQPSSTYPTYPTTTTKYTTDALNGNSYTTTKNLDGSTNVQGMNLQTGSLWSAKIEKNGQMTGYDKDFNYWTYNPQTKAYFNFGTGKSCFGEGALRTCY